MSNYGLVTGDAGNIQFDTNRPLIGLWEHGSVSTWAKIPTYVDWKYPDTLPHEIGYVHTFDYNCNITAVAVRPNTSTLVAGRVDRVPAYFHKLYDYNWPGVGSRGNIFSSSKTNTVEYAIYSPDAEGRIIPSCGLITYDENGVIVFNSGLRHLKITEIIEVNRTPLVTLDNTWWPTPGTVTFSHNTPNPFYIIPNNYIYMPYEHFHDRKLYWGMCVLTIGVQKISATSAKLERMILYVCKYEGKVVHDIGPATFAVPNPLRIAVCVL